MYLFSTSMSFRLPRISKINRIMHQEKYFKKITPPPLLPFSRSLSLSLPLPLSPPQVDEEVALDQAVKFCQIQLATSAQRQVNHLYLLPVCWLRPQTMLSPYAAAIVTSLWADLTSETDPFSSWWLSCWLVDYLGFRPLPEISWLALTGSDISSALLCCLVQFNLISVLSSRWFSLAFCVSTVTRSVTVCVWLNIHVQPLKCK